MASETGRSDSAGRSGARRARRGTRPYRKRHPLPAIALIALLGLLAAGIWYKVTTSETAIGETTRCQPAADPPSDVTFTPQEYTALDETAPIPPSAITLRVRNASSTHGLAHRASSSLDELGFDKLKKPANDPAYEDDEPDCYGQIRYGREGEAAARTVSLLDPCLELVRTSQDDAEVDMVLGNDFRGIHVSDAAHKILDYLREQADEHPTESTETQQAGGAESSISSALLRKARDAYC